MNLKSYTGIIFAVAFVPAFVVLITGCILWFFKSKIEGLMLIIMKGVVSKKNIDKRPTYLVCNRKLPSLSKSKFVICSIFIITICVQCFFTLAIVDVTYECIHSPGIDCFKRKDDVVLSDTFAFDESPVNCSTISRDDFVICYRLTVLDPERAFIGAAAGYLLFKMLNFGLLIVAHSMLWVAQKWERTTLLYFKAGFTLSITISISVPLILRIYLDDVESAFRKMSFTVLLQFSFVLALVIYFIARLPWEEFGESEEYYGDASLPDNGNAHDNEMD